MTQPSSTSLFAALPPTLPEADVIRKVYRWVRRGLGLFDPTHYYYSADTLGSDPTPTPPTCLAGILMERRHDAALQKILTPDMFDTAEKRKNLTINGNGLLHLAVAAGNVAMLDWFLANGVPVDETFYPIGTPLFLAARLGRPQCASSLSVAGASWHTSFCVDFVVQQHAPSKARRNASAERVSLPTNAWVTAFCNGDPTLLQLALKNPPPTPESTHQMNVIRSRTPVSCGLFGRFLKTFDRSIPLVGHGYRYGSPKLWWKMVFSTKAYDTYFTEAERIAFEQMARLDIPLTSSLPARVTSDMLKKNDVKINDRTRCALLNDSTSTLTLFRTHFKTADIAPFWGRQFDVIPPYEAHIHHHGGYAGVSNYFTNRRISIHPWTALMLRLPAASELMKPALTSKIRARFWDDISALLPFMFSSDQGLPGVGEFKAMQTLSKASISMWKDHLMVDNATPSQEITMQYLLLSKNKPLYSRFKSLVEAAAQIGALPLPAISAALTDADNNDPGREHAFYNDTFDSWKISIEKRALMVGLDSLPSAKTPSKSTTIL